jgi:hypothetical protein
MTMMISKAVPCRASKVDIYCITGQLSVVCWVSAWLFVLFLGTDIYENTDKLFKKEAVD